VELDRRLKRYESDPGKLLSLEELQARIKKRK
jgi:putative addiction module component (TIGR02574 family)